MNIKSLAFAYCPSFLRPTLDRIERSPLGYRLAKGVFWSTVGAVSSRSVMLVASIIVARLLGKTVFGEYGMVRSTVEMFIVFAGAGLGMTSTRYVASFRSEDPERAGRVIGLSGLLAIATGGLTMLGLFVFSPWLAEHTIDAPHLTGVLRIAAVILFINALNGAQTGALSGVEAFRPIARVNFAVGVVSCPVLVAGAYYGGLVGTMYAVAFTAGFQWLLSRIALREEMRRHGIPLTFKGCTRELPILWQFALPAVAALSLNMPVNWVCRALLVNEVGGYAEMGVFNAANQWFTLIVFLPGLLGRVVLPILAERLGQNDRARSKRTLVLGLKINAVLTLPIAFFGSCLSPLIMGLYGDGFRSGWPVMVITLFSAALVSCEAPVTQLVAASGRMWTGLGMNAVWATTFVVATLALVKSGAIGLAAAGAIAYAVQALAIVGFAVCVLREK